MTTRFSALPADHGLYRRENEHDACGVAMVATMRGHAGHDIVDHALTALLNLDHRGATGADPLVGDGAGILTQVPDRFLREVFAELGTQLPEAGAYVVGNGYLPQDGDERWIACERFASIAQEEGLNVLAWRDLAVEDGIVSGRLRVGDVLPAERDLAAQLAVSRAVVREGVRALHAIGVVDSRVGAGAAGGTVITAVPTEALNRFLRMHVALAQFSLLDVVDVRCSLEGLSARLAKTAAAMIRPATTVEPPDPDGGEAETALDPVDVSDIEEVWHAVDPPYADLFAWLEGRAERPSPDAPGRFRPVSWTTAVRSAADTESPGEPARERRATRSRRGAVTPACR